MGGRYLALRLLTEQQLEGMEPVGTFVTEELAMNGAEQAPFDSTIMKSFAGTFVLFKVPKAKPKPASSEELPAARTAHRAPEQHTAYPKPDSGRRER